MMSHWYIKMDSKYTPRYEEENQKSVELAYDQLQLATAVEALGKGRRSKPKTAIGKTATGKEPPLKELPTKNLPTKALVHTVPIAEAHTKENDRPASLCFATPNVGDEGATVERARPICRMDPPDGEASDQVEQSRDLSLTNLVQITTPNILLSWDGPTYSIRSTSKICIFDEDDFEEHLIITNGMNLHFPRMLEHKRIEVPALA